MKIEMFIPPDSYVVVRDLVPDEEDPGFMREETDAEIRARILALLGNADDRPPDLTGTYRKE